MSVDVARDFDRLAQLDSGGWSHNNHYHDFLLRKVPADCDYALEVGCGTGALARQMAERAKHVTALDLSSEMIRVAKSQSAQLPNIDYQVADVVECDLPAEHFNCIATVATLHHLPLRNALLKLKGALKPGGTLIVLDLFEPERNLGTIAGWRDACLDVVAMGVSVSFRLIHNRRLRPPREVQAAWEEHGRHDTYPTLRDIRALCADLFPGAIIKRHLLWRYSIVWNEVRTESGSDRVSTP